MVLAMLIKELARIPEFKHLAKGELLSLADQVSVLSIPPRRWIVQEPSRPKVHLYLLRGTVECMTPRRQLRSKRYGALNHVYPSFGAMRSLGPCQLLLVDSDRREFLMHRGGGQRLLDAGEGQHVWLARFLDSELLRGIERHHWQRLVAAFSRRQYVADADLILEGQAGDHCFVIERGHAVVHRSGRTLRHLNPGDFFGEDALVLDALRNASVSALEDMVVHAIDKDNFLEHLLHRVVRWVDVQAEGAVLDLDVDVDLSCLRSDLDRFANEETIYVRGGSPQERLFISKSI